MRNLLSSNLFLFLIILAIYSTYFLLSGYTIDSSPFIKFNLGFRILDLNIL